MDKESILKVLTKVKYPPYDKDNAGECCNAGKDEDCRVGRARRRQRGPQCFNVFNREVVHVSSVLLEIYSAGFGTVCAA